MRSIRMIIKTAYTPIWAPVLVCIGIVINLNSGAQPGLGEALTPVLWNWAGLYLVAPAIAAIAAYDGARLIPVNGESVWTLPAIRRSFTVRLWAVSALGAVLPLLIVQLWSLSHALEANEDPMRSALFSLGAGCSTVAFIVGLGLSLGRLLGRLYGPILAFFIALVLQLANYMGSIPVLEYGGISGSVFGLKFSSASMIFQTGGLIAALIGVAYALFASPVSSRWDMRIAAGGALSLCLVPALVIPQVDVRRFEAIPPARMSYYCMTLEASVPGQQGSQVCGYFEHKPLFRHIFLAWEEVSEAAAKAGIRELPSSFVESLATHSVSDYPGEAPGEAALYLLGLEQMDDPDFNINASWVIQELSHPTWCPELYSSPGPSETLWHAVTEVGEALESIVTSPDADHEQEVGQFNNAWHTLITCGQENE